MILLHNPDKSLWYWERKMDWKISQSFPSEELARQARRNGTLQWSYPHER